MVNIPSQNDWSYKKTVIQPGPRGSWDCRLEGMISPCAMVKKNNTFFLYYIGSDGERRYPHTDKGPRHRALGVATSSDGLNFTKYSGNPIVQYSPTGNDEEGVFSAGVVLDDNGDVVIYYGAMKSPSASSTVVSSDVRVITSHDGFRFINDTKVLSHTDSGVWGYGDELFPLGALKHNGIWYVYYTVVASGIRWVLGVAWGNSKSNLSNSKEFYKSFYYVKGGCDPVPLNSTEFAMFIGQDDGNDNEHIKVKTVKYSDPTKALSTVETYYMDTCSGHVVFYDNQKWVMYYRKDEDNQLKVRTAGSSLEFPINFISIPPNASVNKI